MRRFALAVILVIVASTVLAQDKKAKKEPAPKLLYAIPLVARPGEKQKVTLRGRGLAGVKGVNVTGAEGAAVKLLSAKSVGVSTNYPVDRLGDSEVEIELTLPKAARPGAIKLSAMSGAGESNAYSLLIRDALPVVIEKEPNDGFAQAQALTLPAAVEGTIKNERDVDVYKFEGKKGDKVRIEIEAARFGSPLDGFLTLHDSGGRLLDSVDDSNGSPDPILVVTLPKNDTYLITVIDANDLGGPPFGYRLVVRRE